MPEDIYLFYDGHDLKALEGLTGKVFSAGHYYARTLKRTLFRQQIHTGYYVSFYTLCRQLQKAGHKVYINNFKVARQNPDHPIGLHGFFSVLDKTKDLQNPVLYGSGELKSPDAFQHTAKNPRIKSFLVKSGWMKNLYSSYTNKPVQSFFTGFDIQDWPDTGQKKKTYDFLIYDKIYFERETYKKAVLDKLTDLLNQKKLHYKILRYGKHITSTYKNLLHQSKALIWLSVHETQGMACHEAMARNLPVLAWDEGKIMDPALKPYVEKDIGVSSVPYFSPQAGLRFQIANLENSLEIFLKQLETYHPRQFIEENLSAAQSMQIYLDAYRSLMK